MSIRLSVNATAIFDDVESARAAGLAVETLLRSGNYAAAAAGRLFDFETQRDVPLRKPVFDRSKIVVGFQEANDKLQKYVKEIDSHVADPSDTSAWQPLYDHARATGEIDFEQLTAIAAERLQLQVSPNVIDLVAQAIGKVNAAIAEREFKTAMTPKKQR